MLTHRRLKALLYLLVKYTEILEKSDLAREIYSHLVLS